MQQSLQDMPLQVLQAQFVHPSRQQDVGKRFRIAHLTSKRGKSLNGKTALVIGFDKDTAEARAHCRIIEDDDDNKNNAAIKLKVQNLIHLDVPNLEDFMKHSSPMSNDELLPYLERSLEKHMSGGLTDRNDLLHRLHMYEKLIEKIRDEPENATENDYCFPCGAGSELLGQDNFGIIMNSMKPACVGNQIMNVRYADVGLKGDGRTICSICNDVLQAPRRPAAANGDDESIVLVTLPCLHVFHEHCLVSWLDSDLGRRNWNCPQCRAPVPDLLDTYRTKYKEQLQKRLDEFPLSGFCTKCLIWNMERNRNDAIPTM